VPQRLLRTIQIGAPQGITVEEIRQIAADSSTEYTTEMLARSALLVLQQDNLGLISYNELLDGALNHLVRDGNAFQPPPGLPDFRGKETVFAMVYAMVMSGDQQEAIDLLGKHLQTGSEYKRAVALSALRNIGTQNAIGLIQQYAERGPDRNLGETTLADEDYPALSEMHDRWNLIPPSRRTQDNLRAIVQRGCDQQAAMAAYWLGFFPPNIDPNKEVAEIQALEAMAHANTPDCEMMEHVIALKALGLRAAKSVAYWKRLAQQTDNSWERHQIVINAWGRWGAKFAPAALDLLESDPAQYVQWELFDGNIDTRQGWKYRRYWDIWIPANVLLVQQEDEAAGPPQMSGQNLNELLAWLESGARPRDPWVSNHFFYHLAPLVSDGDTFRFLRLFNAHPGRNQNWWIVQNLRDPAALRLLDYWVTLPAPQNQREMLEAAIDSLQNRARNGTKAAANVCCGPTEECLREQVIRSAAAAGDASTAEIHSEAEARAWLQKGPAPAADYAIRFTDDLKRSAIVIRKGAAAAEHWQYLYDCWRNTDEKGTGE
jgi:hypothetical protein